MEDAHTHLLSLSEDKDAAFFAVYDGHGGAKVAQYAGNHVHKKIVGHPSYKKGDVVDAIKQGFLEIDSDMLKDENMRDELAGTTAVVVLLKNNKIFCVNRVKSGKSGSSLTACNTLSTICEELMNLCLAPDCQMGGLGCDNMTVVLVCLLQGMTYEELAAKCACPPLPHPIDEVPPHGSDSSTSETEDADDDEHSKETKGKDDKSIQQAQETSDTISNESSESSALFCNEKSSRSHLSSKGMVENSVREGSEMAVA
ncbi:probable protein phosphatase 2C T23F11.1 [Centruroides sculpturatus]|uniref:probable protein phosphatase 2C T23F11.1 n=1 Tax=Centruroides sculpturatus TaxID=218467 RepID=UPI000C6DCC88|nr:probable protein phosphatase 2C T23F11.1 [Centruroides sculpturatus]